MTKIPAKLSSDSAAAMEDPPEEEMAHQLSQILDFRFHVKAPEQLEGASKTYYFDPSQTILRDGKTNPEADRVVRDQYASSLADALNTHMQDHGMPALFRCDTGTESLWTNHERPFHSPVILMDAKFLRDPHVLEGLRQSKQAFSKIDEECRKKAHAAGLHATAEAAQGRSPDEYQDARWQEFLRQPTPAKHLIQ